MRSMTLKTPFLAAFLALAAANVATTVSEPAAAQGAAKKPDKKTRDAARTAYQEGETAYKKGEYRAAVISFKKANDLIPSPHASFWIAMSVDKQGNLKEATELFEKLLADENVGKLGAEKIKTARDRLDALKKTPAKLEITTDPAGASVSVDGTPQMGETPMTIDLAPGTHQIAVSAPGMKTSEFEVTAEPGGSDEKTIELEAAPDDATDVPVVAPPPEEPPPEETEPPKAKSKVPAYVTLGIAGASAIVGTIFGIQALGKKGDFDDDPTSDTADDVERNALIADMAFGVAITLGVTGVVLLTTAGGDAEKDARTKHRKLPKKARLVVAPYASPKGGGAAARWTF